MALGVEVSLGPGHIVLDGDPALLPKKGAEPPPPPQFSAHFDCGQTAGCIKMPLGMEVGLRLGDFVLDEDPDPRPQKGGGTNFRPMYIVAKRPLWIKMTLGTEVNLGPGDVVLDGVTAPPPGKGHNPLVFGSCLWSMVGKRMNG